MAASMHSCLNWAKERTDEMDAVAASRENKVGGFTARSRSAGLASDGRVRMPKATWGFYRC